MTAPVQSKPIQSLVVSSLSPEFVAAVRAGDLDDAGHGPQPVTEAEGGAPLRCCCRRSIPGDDLLLLSYAPLRHGVRPDGFDPGPYDELGPVFIHATSCPEQASPSQYPAAFATSDQVFRCYRANGSILGGQVVPPDSDHEAVARTLLDDPSVAFIHTRNVVYGCFMLEIARSN